MDTTNTENVTSMEQEDSISLDAFNEDTADTTPAGTVVVVNGVTCTPETHVFRNGSPVLKKDGTPKLKPGRKTGISPHKKAAVSNDEKTIVNEGTAHAVSAISEERASSQVARADVPKEQPSRVQREVLATVERSFGKIGALETEDTTLSVRTFVTAPATVELGYGLTLNIGNYESARVDVKLSVPCYREEVDEAYAWAREWAEARIRKEVTEIKGMATDQKATHF